MPHIAGTGFTEADDQELEPVTFDVSWRSRTDRKSKGVETFTCVDRIATGVLLDVEGGKPSAAHDLIIDALLDDDHMLDKQNEPIPGTSSLERYQALTHDKTRETPAGEITATLQGLYNVYTQRRSPQAAATRPTTSSGQSVVQLPPTGRSSTGGPRKRASTSGRSRQSTG